MQNETVTNFNSPIKTLEDLPEKFRNLFSSYPSFNTVQSEVLDNVMRSNKSVVIAAPTGSGKTAVLELAIVKLLMDIDNSGCTTDFKMVYICPVKALCRERFDDWNPRFSKLGVSCIEVTGDGGDYFDLQGYHLIITTPEKWDSLTRKWRDNAGLVQMVKLLMIDEVHLLSDNKRGPVLEAIVCRMKTVSKSLNIEGVRFFAISATIYNTEDLAVWLGTKDSPAHCYKFGNEVRPVHLDKIIKGFPIYQNQSSFLFDIQLSYKLKPLILEHSKGKPTLIFCSTRKSVMMTSKVLSEQLTFHFSDMQIQYLKNGATQISDGKLKELVMFGVGFHHAGMTMEDRHIIQNLFVAGHLPILVATSTLAMGVNLPAHLVIIKSTQQFHGGQWEEYPESSILQMIGRAGRPQFDTTATAIIMTQENKTAKYERLLDSKEILESSLHLHLPEHLNSEIVLYTITDLGIAMEWMRCTYLYVRALKNPKHYGFDPKADSHKIEKSLQTIVEKEINGLTKAGLIEFDGIDISPTADGRLMSHFYLSFETFKLFLEINGSETMPEILQVLAQAHEFSEMQLRVNEKRLLNELNRNKNRATIRFPLKGKINTRALKINCLIQACLGCLPIQDPGLSQEAHRIVKTAERLAKCLAEYLSKKPFYQSILSTILLAKCLHAKLWEDSPNVCRQLERIGPTLSSLLSSCGKTSFDAIENSNPRDLERILNRAPPFGNALQDAVRHLPRYDLQIEKLENQILVIVSLMNVDVLLEKNTAGDRHCAALIVGDTDNNLLYYCKLSDQTLSQKNFQIFAKQKGSPHKIMVNLISETWIGFDLKEEIEITPCKKEPEKTPAKQKRKSVGQGTKTPKKKKGLEVLENYSYKLEKNENFCTGEKAAHSQVEIQKPKPIKIPFKPCFDVDIEIPEEILQKRDANINQKNMRKPAIPKFMPNIPSTLTPNTGIDFPHINRKNMDDLISAIPRSNKNISSTLSFKIDLDFPHVNRQIRNDSKPLMPRSISNIPSALSFNMDLDFSHMNRKNMSDFKPVSNLINKIPVNIVPQKQIIEAPGRSLMQFEESLSLMQNSEKPKVNIEPKNSMQFNDTLNLRPRMEQPKMITQLKSPSFVSLENIYERLKRTPRSNNQNRTLSDSGYSSGLGNF